MEIVKSIMLAKLETVRNTDVTPAVASDEFIVHGQLSFDHVTNPLPRPVPLPYFGELPPLVVGQAYKLNAKVEVTPSGAAGTPWRIGRFYRAAGCTETISAGVSVTYTPHSTLLGETLTIYPWFGGTRHIMLGCVCNIKMPLVAGEMILHDIEITGLYGGAVADVTFPTPTFESLPPVIWTAANFKFNSVTTLVCSKLDFDFGNEITPRKSANASLTPGISDYYVSNRKPKVSFDIEKEDLSTLNPWTLHNAQTTCNLETKPTGDTGKKIELLINNITLDAPKYGEDTNKMIWPLSGQPRVSLTTGNSEFSIIHK